MKIAVKPNFMKKIKIITLGLMLLSASSFISLNRKADVKPNFNSGVCAAVAGAVTKDERWIGAGFAIMELSAEASVIPGFQAAAALGFF